MENMQAKSAVGSPVVHDLKGNQGQFFVNGKLGDGPVLDTVRPTPENLAVLEIGQIRCLRLR